VETGSGPGALRLLWLFLRLGAQQELAYRGNLGAQALLSGTNLVALLAFVALVYGRTDSLAGWRPPELLALWGVFQVLSGLLGAIVQPSLQRLVEDVHRGTFDHTLAKPVDAQLLASIQQVQVWRLLDTALGVALLALAVATLPSRVGPAQALAFVVALLLGGAMVYACCLALATLAFWLLRIENVLLAFLTFWEAGRWPVTLYPQWLRIGLTFVIPVAFATTVPAEALSGRLTPATLLAGAALAGGFLVASRRLWLRGLRRYAGASA
jgi:ABC-2 type transport system permease protein